MSLPAGIDVTTLTRTEYLWLRVYREVEALYAPTKLPPGRITCAEACARYEVARLRTIR